MTAILFLIFAPFIFLITRNALGESGEVSTFAEKLFFRLFITLITIYLLALFAGNYDFYIKGYRSTSILFIIMTMTGMIYWLLDRRKVFSNLIRATLFCFSIVTIAFSFFLFIEILSDYQNQLFYNGDKFRLEDTRRGIGEPCILPTLFIKKDFYEQKFKLADSSFYYCVIKSDISNIDIKVISNNKIVVSYFLVKKRYEDVPNPLTVTYVMR